MHLGSGEGIVSLRFTPLQNHPSLKLRVTGVIPPFCYGSDPCIGVQIPDIKIKTTARVVCYFDSGEGIVYSHSFYSWAPFQIATFRTALLLVLNCYFVGPGVLIHLRLYQKQNRDKPDLIFGSGEGIRTPDQRIMIPLLYH